MLKIYLLQNDKKNQLKNRNIFPRFLYLFGQCSLCKVPARSSIIRNTTLEIIIMCKFNNS